MLGNEPGLNDVVGTVEGEFCDPVMRSLGGCICKAAMSAAPLCGGKERGIGGMMEKSECNGIAIGLGRGVCSLECTLGVSRVASPANNSSKSRALCETSSFFSRWEGDIDDATDEMDECEFERIWFRVNGWDVSVLLLVRGDASWPK
jgi:hypothetical protein